MCLCLCVCVSMCCISFGLNSNIRTIRFKISTLSAVDRQTYSIQTPTQCTASAKGLDKYFPLRGHGKQNRQAEWKGGNHAVAVGHHHAVHAYTNTNKYTIICTCLCSVTKIQIYPSLILMCINIRLVWKRFNWLMHVIAIVFSRLKTCVRNVHGVPHYQSIKAELIYKGKEIYMHVSRMTV